MENEFQIIESESKISDRRDFGLSDADGAIEENTTYEIIDEFKYLNIISKTIIKFLVSNGDTEFTVHIKIKFDRDNKTKQYYTALTDAINLEMQKLFNQRYKFTENNLTYRPIRVSEISSFLTP